MSINLAQSSHGCTGLTNALVCFSNHITNLPRSCNQNSFTRIDRRYFDVLHPTDGTYFDIRVIKIWNAAYMHTQNPSLFDGRTFKESMSIGIFAYAIALNDNQICEVICDGTRLISAAKPLHQLRL